jgi:hypothetical protein
MAWMGAALTWETKLHSRLQRSTDSEGCTRRRKRTEEESDLSKKRLRDQAKRAKDIGKRARGAKSRGSPRGNSAIVVTTPRRESSEKSQMFEMNATYCVASVASGWASAAQSEYLRGACGEQSGYIPCEGLLGEEQ